MKPFLMLALLLLLAACNKAPQAPADSLFKGLSDDNPSASLYRSPLTLPDDYRSHDNYQLEWWYLTVVAEDEEANPFGFQFTLFRLKQDDVPENVWADNQLWMAHASLHSSEQHWFEERLARGGVGNAGVATPPFRAWLDNWEWQAMTGTTPFPSDLTVAFKDGTSVTLTLTAAGPPVRHGHQGISHKSANGDLRSYYYSQPFITVTGQIDSKEKPARLTGKGWFDHEWTSELARDEALGWDWLSLHLDDERKVMVFRMHTAGASPFVTGTLINAAGDYRTLDADEVTFLPDGYETINGHTMPVRWQLSLPREGIDVQIAPFKPGQYNTGQFPYYEGRVEVSGTHTGSGFLELTGY
ncbi:lipocalin-like domain-containing protein [Alteromonas sp. CYL-A6]|uniref:lipocalin-like domain-containing protein n=1 Tax=Alteromonas nitratireducens TaxID=3390813 RepID=UPI0034B483EF